MADKFSVPASAADALSRSRRAAALSGVEWAAPLIVILPNWPAAVPPISIATLPPAKLVNPQDIEIVLRNPLVTKGFAVSVW